MVVVKHTCLINCIKPHASAEIIFEWKSFKIVVFNTGIKNHFPVKKLLGTKLVLNRIIYLKSKLSNLSINNKKFSFRPYSSLRAHILLIIK